MNTIGTNQEDLLEDISGLLETDMLIQLAPATIIPDPDQPRKSIDEERLQWLADSIAVNGLEQPLIVRDIGGGQYMIISGERRWRASKLANVGFIPCVLRQKPGEDIKILLSQGLENLHKDKLPPIDLANWLQKLVDALGSADAVAKQIGYSKSWVSHKLHILGLPGDVQQVAQDGLVTDKAALRSLGKLDDDKRHEAIKLVREGEDVKSVLTNLAPESSAPVTEKKARKPAQERRVSWRLNDRADVVLLIEKLGYGTVLVKENKEWVRDAGDVELQTWLEQAIAFAKVRESTNNGDESPLAS